MTRTTRMRVWLLCFVGAVATLSQVPIAQRAQPSALDEVTRPRLLVDGYQDICVYVDELFAKNNRTSLTTAMVRNRAEVRLRAAGLRPKPYMDNLSTCGANRGMAKDFMLNVRVSFGSTEAFLVRAAFDRHAAWEVPKSSPSDDGIRGGSVTIEAYEAFGITSASTSTILDALDSVLDQFLAAYLKANQSR